MKKLLFIILLFSQPAFANEAHIGTFASVSESECNWAITLRSGGNGEAISTCRLENGSHRDYTKTHQINWESSDRTITVTLNKKKEQFLYQEKLSCSDFGNTGFAPGLVLTSEENSAFWGVGGKFWKSTDCE